MTVPLGAEQREVLISPNEAMSAISQWDLCPTPLIDFGHPRSVKGVIDNGNLDERCDMTKGSRTPRIPLSWILSAVALLGVMSTVTSTSVQATVTFVNRTTTDGLPSNVVLSVFADGQNVYAGTPTGLGISTNGGASFVAKNTANGLGGNVVNSVWASGNEIFAGTVGGVSFSINGGTSWTTKLGSQNVVAVAKSGQTVFAATFYGLNRSTDGGQNFAPSQGISGDVRDVQIVGSDVYATLSTIQGPGGLYKSTDNGATFTLLAAQSQADKLYVDGSKVYMTAAERLYVSADGGTTFQELQRSTVTGAQDSSQPQPMILDVAASGSLLLVTSNYGLRVSSNGGQTFTGYTVNDGLGANFLAGGVALDSGNVYVGTLPAGGAGGLSIGTGVVPSSPTVTGVSPPSGSTVGGTSITVTGTNFANGATVTVGGAPCTNVNVTNTTTITCTTPSGSAGTASVVVTSSGQSNASNTLFTYVAPATTTVAPTTTVPATTTVPTTTVPATTVPATTVAPTGPSLVNSSNQQALTQQPGAATALVNGQAVSVSVETPADSPAGRVDPEDRTPAQVQSLQTAADDLVGQLNQSAGGNSGLGVVDTPTGANLTGLLDVPVPIENTVLVEAGNKSTLFAAVNEDGSVTEVQPGAVIEVLGNGEVGVAAFGLTPNDPVEFVLMSTPTLIGSYTVGADGSVKAQAQLPATVGDGNHTLVVASPSVQASLGLKIAPARATSLPATGADGSGRPLLVAFWLLVGGAFVAVIRRRRPIVD